MVCGQKESRQVFTWLLTYWAKKFLLQAPKGLTQQTAKGFTKGTKYTKYNDELLTIQMQKKIQEKKLMLPSEKWHCTVRDASTVQAGPADADGTDPPTPVTLSTSSGHLSMMASHGATPLQNSTPPATSSCPDLPTDPFLRTGPGLQRSRLLLEDAYMTAYLERRSCSERRQCTILTLVILMPIGLLLLYYYLFYTT